MQCTHSDQQSTLTYSVNPLYTDTRCNDKIRYNDNLTGTKFAQEVVGNYARILYLLQETYVLFICLSEVILINIQNICSMRK